MKLKLDDQGNAIIENGWPVCVFPDGSESAVDLKAQHVELASVKRENAERRNTEKALTAKVAAFGDIDPEKAIKALAFADSVDGKKVMGDDDLEKAFQARMKPVLDELAAAKTEKENQAGTIRKMMVSDKFKSSEFLKKTIFSEMPEVAEATFGGNIKVDGDKLVAVDYSGNPIWSSVKAGEPADFDEAIAYLVNNSPRKDYMLKASGASGSGSTGSTGSTGSVASRLASIKNPTERLNAARAAGITT